jgi:hypothetical protein
MTGQSTITGSAPAYAGGSIRAMFQAQGGGRPAVASNGSTIAADGSFSLLAWDNSNAIYAPSQTTFIIEIGKTSYSATTRIAGTTASITSLLAAAPAPSGSIGGVAISGTPTVGQKPTATSANTATWQ